MLHAITKRERLPLFVVLALLPAGIQAAGRPAVSRPRSILPPVHQARSSTRSTADPWRVRTSLVRLPLRLEPNQGQTDPRVRFLSRGSGHTLFLTDTEAVLVLRGSAECRPGRQPLLERNTQHATRNTVLRMHLLGAARRPAAVAEARLPGVVNYFKGKDPSKWRTNIPTYARARFQGVYPGIDLVYYGNQGHLEYDFLVAPGADPGRIRLAFDGAENTTVDAAGDLVLTATRGSDGRPVQEVHFRKPVVTQEIAGRRVPVAAAWGLDEAFRVQGPGFTRGRSTQRAARSTSGNRQSKIGNRKYASFRVAAYDRTRPLVIDPVLTYSSYLGAGSEDTVRAMAVGADGSAFVAGVTSSANFPITAGAVQDANHGSGDAFVAKVNPAGTSLLYATYLGGSQSESARSIAVGADGSAYIAGHTLSNDFPTTLGAVQGAPAGSWPDAFVAKLSRAGSALLYATCLGGSADDAANALALGADGSVTVAGATSSADFPVTAGAFQTAVAGGTDGFVATLNAGGTALLHATYLGGGGTDTVNALAAGTDGSAWVAGYTSSAGFPTTAGAPQRGYAGGIGDAFVARLSPGATALVYSTFLGGRGEDGANALAVSADGSAFVAGHTYSSDLPTTAGAFQPAGAGDEDAFAAKLNPAGTAILYATYLGGGSTDRANALAIGPDGSAYVAGYTWSSNFPTTPTAYQRAHGDYLDAFLAKVNPGGTALLYATYLGGSSGDSANALAVDANGAAYLAGDAVSGDFPTTPAAFQGTYGGSEYGDAFVAKFVWEGPPSRLGFTVPPGPAVAGAPIVPSVAVTVQDRNGLTVPGAVDRVTVSLGANPGGATLLGTRTVAAVNGTATFTDLRVSKPGTGYTLVASSAGIAGASSARFNVSPGAAAKLVFTAQPPNAVAGARITPAVRVAMQDRFGNLATTTARQVTIAIGSNPSAGALSGTTTATTSQGTATFTSLSINKAGLRYTLTATAPGVASATSRSFNIAPGTATKLGFVAQPADTVAGASINPLPRVAVQDRFGNTVSAGAPVNVAIAIGTNPGGGTLSGIAARNTTNGVAVFSGLSINRAGTRYTLRATASGLASATSVAFNVTRGPAAKLAFVAQPHTVGAGAPISPAVRVAVQDRMGNAVTTTTNSVALAISANPGAGTLSGTKTVAATNGVAAFAGLSINKAGSGYVLRATSAGLSAAYSAPFDVTPAAPSRLICLVQPASATAGAAIVPPVQVGVFDRFRNLVSGATHPITVRLGRNPTGAALSGTLTAAAVDGVAMFAGLKVSKAGSGYTLAAAASGLRGTVSTAFNVALGVATRATITFAGVDSGSGTGTMGLERYAAGVRISGFAAAPPDFASIGTCLILPASPTVGQTWTEQGVSNGYAISTTAVVASLTDSVTVPAGTFAACLRIEETITFPDAYVAGAYAVAARTRWFAGGIGPVRYEARIRRVSNPDQIVTGVLVSRTVSSSSATDWWPLQVNNVWVMQESHQGNPCTWTVTGAEP